MTAALSQKAHARIAGGFYLLVGIFGGFAEGFVEPKMYVPGDAAATTLNVVANAGLVRLGVVADLLDQVFFVFTAMALFLLLVHVHRNMAIALAVSVGLAVAIASLNTVFLFEALQVATDGAYVTAFGAAGASALVLLLVETQHYGLLIAQIFFGLWLAPLGYLFYKSRLFPKVLGVALVVASACYLIDLLAAFLDPGFGRAIHGVIVIPCAVAEIGTVLYLLIVGVRTQKPSGTAPVFPAAA